MAVGLGRKTQGTNAPQPPTVPTVDLIRFLGRYAYPKHSLFSTTEQSSIPLLSLRDQKRCGA